MTKEEFFKYIEEIKTDKILITDSLNEIEEEVQNNCWSFSIPDELTSVVTVADLNRFLQEVKANRKQQLKDSKSSSGLLFYMWYDDQAVRLKFNFINAQHKELPFKATLTFVDEEEILTDFLTNSQTDLQTVKVYRELIED